MLMIHGQPERRIHNAFVEIMLFASEVCTLDAKIRSKSSPELGDNGFRKCAFGYIWILLEVGS